MSGCERLRADLAAIAALPAGDPEREAARAHARGCTPCARALGEAERLHALVGGAGWLRAAGPPPEAPRAIVAELRREAARRRLATALAVCLAFALAVGLARHRSPSRQDLSAALGLAVAAACLGGAGRRWAPAAIGGAVAAALAVALATGAAGPVAGSLGAECIAME
ncbi:MAG: hypothetical protein ACJ79L_15375, partial [Anaeromyxobacteraceae bacterium]